MKARPLILATLLATVTGCSSALVGTWKAAEQPAKDGPFFIKQAAFRNDGSYSASARQGENDLFLNGKYDFNGVSLTLKSEGKSERKYKATVWWGRELELKADGETHRLKKQ